MREILFRGKRVDNGEWVYGDLIHISNGKVGIWGFDNNQFLLVNPLTVEQFTGLKDKNRDVIDAIDSGILREVSIGCAVKKTVCSVCGEELSSCSHVKGETYGGKLCYGELINPCDAYEFGFVAIPKQPEVK